MQTPVIIDLIAVAVLTAVLRRREFAIEKVCGFAPAHLAGMLGAEALFQAAATAVLFLAASPMLNLGTVALWSVNILTPNLLAVGAAICFGLSALAFLITAAVAAGDRKSVV